MDIITYLISIIQEQYKQICWLLMFICKYIPLKQWEHDDSHSPKYQKFKVDELPKIVTHAQDWNWKDLISYYQARYNKTSSRSFAELNAISLKTALVLSALHPFNISLGTMAN